MSQTKKGSAIEACTNVVVGLGVSLAANALVFPLFGFTPSLTDNAVITLIYTAISLARSYLLRRLFNRLHAARPSIQWNRPEILPPVGCPLVLLVKGAAVAGERINHLTNRAGVMDYRLNCGRVVKGRFEWTYP